MINKFKLFLFKVNERTAELNEAKKNIEELLHKILPPSIADKLAKV